MQLGFCNVYAGLRKKLPDGFSPRPPGKPSGEEKQGNNEDRRREVGELRCSVKFISAHQHAIEDTPREKRKQSRPDDATEISAGHEAAMRLYVSFAGSLDRQDRSNQNPDRQKMDRAEIAPDL